MSDPVPSPCRDQCALDATRGHCTGCLRTLDEIMRWSRMTEADKRAVWVRLNRPFPD